MKNLLRRKIILKCIILILSLLIVIYYIAYKTADTYIITSNTPGLIGSTSYSTYKVKFLKPYSKTPTEGFFVDLFIFKISRFKLVGIPLWYNVISLSVSSIGLKQFIFNLSSNNLE